MNYFFSKVKLSQKFLSSFYFHQLGRHGQAYRDHALLWKLFKEYPEKQKILFRRLEDDKSYYVLSQHKPHNVSEKETGITIFNIQTKIYHPHIEDGLFFRFDLRANPTVSIQNPNRKHSMRHDVLMNAKKKWNEQSDEDFSEYLDAVGKKWLLDRTPQWGVEIDPMSILQKSYTQYKIVRDKEKILFSSLDYQGVLKVTNADLFKKALLQGVGHSKAFGCGLFLVKSVY